jgi:hypothetical protein
MKINLEPRWKEMLDGFYGHHKFFVEMTMAGFMSTFPPKAPGRKLRRIGQKTSGTKLNKRHQNGAENKAYDLISMKQLGSNLNKQPNQRPRVDAGWRVLFAFQCPRPRATQAGCSALWYDAHD